EAARITDKLGHDTARMLLRYQVSELNRFFFDWFGVAQIALSILVAISVLFATNGNKFMLALTAIMILLVVFEKALLTPEITFLGRTIDFVPRDVPSPVRQRFQSVHAAYSTTEIIKLILMTIVAVRLILSSGTRRSRSRSVSVDEDTVSMHR